MHTDALNTDPDSCPPEVKPRPMKTSILVVYDCSKSPAIAKDEVCVQTATFVSLLFRVMAVRDGSDEGGGGG